MKSHDYKGYRFQRPERENGNPDTTCWDILEGTSGGWVAVDRLSTLQACRDMVDSWEGLSRVGALRVAMYQRLCK